jgi:hypothetical protein
LRDRRTNQRLQHSDVGCEVGEDIADPRRFEKGRGERDDLIECVATQVGGNTLPKPRDQVEACTCGTSKHRDNADHSKGGMIEMSEAAAGKAAIDQPPDALPQCQDQPCGRQQSRRGSKRAQTVRPQVGQQQSQRGDP